MASPPPLGPHHPDSFSPSHSRIFASPSQVKREGLSCRFSHLNLCAFFQALKQWRKRCPIICRHAGRTGLVHHRVQHQRATLFRPLCSGSLSVKLLLHGQVARALGAPCIAAPGGLKLFAQSQQPRCQSLHTALCCCHFSHVRFSIS